MAIARETPRTMAGMARADWIAAAVLVLVLLATRAIVFGDPVVDFDEQLYSVIGWRMTHGDLPYVDVWDRKPFGLFLIFAASHALFGPEAIAYQLVASVSAFIGALLVYGLARAQVDRASATAAGALYLLLLALYGSQSGQSEAFHTPMMLAMAWLLRDGRRPDAARRAALAMLIGGLALQVKYTVLPQCLFFGAWALVGEWRRGARVPRLAARAALFAALGLLPTVMVGLFYLWRGHFDAFWFANFVSFFDRVSPPNGRLRHDLLIGYAPLALLVLPGLYAAFRLNPPRDRAAYGFHAAWLLAALATVLLPATVYAYYYAALAAPAILVALPLIDRKGPLRFVPAALLLLFVALLYNPPDRYADSLAERRAEARLSTAITPFVGKERDCLYVFDGPTALYRTTDTCLPTRFIYPDHLNNALETAALGTDQAGEIARILAGRPGVIVTAGTPVTIQQPRNLAMIEQATRRRYRPLITIAQRGRAITAWVRRDLAPAEPRP
jgi:4-amino-4-deoxy-L-arabinose transferase-like glycosyltransferase